MVLMAYFPIDTMVKWCHDAILNASIIHARRTMDPRQMLIAMLEQRRLLDDAITRVERLASGTKRRGRPPKAITEARALAGLHKPSRKKSATA